MTKEYKKEILKTHSVSEEKLYFMVVTCKGCGVKGAMRHIKHSLTKSIDGKRFDEETIECDKCGYSETLIFDIDPFFGNQAYYKDYVINLIEEPSYIIDIVDYKLLGTFYFNIFKKNLRRKDVSDKTLEAEARIAHGCMKEALKFYGSAEELDEEKALFSDINKKIYNKNKDDYSAKYLKYQLSKITSLYNNMEVIKEVCQGLTDDAKQNIKYLRELREGKYKNNKEIVGEIARIEGEYFFQLMTSEDMEKFKKLPGSKRPEDLMTSFNFSLKNNKGNPEIHNREKQIILLERFLQLKLPDSYKQFLKEFGGGFNGKEPIVGKPRIFGLPANKELTSMLGATFFLRIKRDDLPKDFVVIVFLNHPYALCLDLRNKPEKDAPLVKINYMDKGAPIETTRAIFSNYLAKSIEKYCNNN